MKLVIGMDCVNIELIDFCRKMKTLEDSDILESFCVDFFDLSHGLLININGEYSVQFLKFLKKLTFQHILILLWSVLIFQNLKKHYALSLLQW